MKFYLRKIKEGYIFLTSSLSITLFAVSAGTVFSSPADFGALDTSFTMLLPSNIPLASITNSPDSMLPLTLPCAFISTLAAVRHNLIPLLTKFHLTPLFQNSK